MQGLRAWAPSLALWGVGTGLTLSYLLSNTPIFQHDVLIKLPIVCLCPCSITRFSHVVLLQLGNTWVDDTPAEDKPF